MNRRGFLGAMLAACAAPAIVRAESIMRIAAPEIIVSDVAAIVSQYEALYGFTAMEIGRIEGFRFILSPDLPVFADGHMTTTKRRAQRPTTYPGSGHFVSANSYGRRA